MWVVWSCELFLGFVVFRLGDECVRILCWVWFIGNFFLFFEWLDEGVGKLVYVK